MEFIAYDRAGWDDSQARFTHMPSGDTLLCKNHYTLLEWENAQIEWFSKMNPALTIHKCPGAYSMDGDLMGTVEKRLENLKQRD